nr:HD domain-containing phosphohydrolase [Meiothermus sp. CFH 77666]
MVGAFISVIATTLLLAAHGGRERWGMTPFTMLASAMGLIALVSAFFMDVLGLYFGLVFTLQVGLLLVALEGEKRWKSTLGGLLLISVLALGLHNLMRFLDVPVMQVAQSMSVVNFRIAAQGLAMLLGGMLVWWLYPRLAVRNRIQALVVVLALINLLNVGLLFLVAREGLGELVASFLLQAVLIGPLLGLYLEWSRRQTHTRPIETAYTALLSTVEALAQGSEEELWPRLLESAVRVVPGAQAGSIRLRQGSDFVFVAQQGFGEGILGVRSSELETMAWHGNPAAWRQGQPRIANHADIQRILAAHQENELLARQLDQASANKVSQIRSTLCMPILLGGEVVAEINLDAFRDRAFSEQSVEVARQYALQVTVLLAAHRQQAELEARIHEFEVIEALSAALRGLKGTGEITKRLVRETIRLMNSEHAALLLIEPDGQHMRCYAAAGIFLEIKDQPVPQGQGFSWAAVETRAPIWSQQAHLDKRAFGRFKTPRPPFSEIVMPLFSSKGHPLGVLISARNGAGTFSDRDMRLMQVISNIAANTLERVRANESLEAEIAEKTALLELSQMLGGNDASLLPLALEKIRQMGHADCVVLGVLESEVFRTRAVAGDVRPGLARLLEKHLLLNHPVVQQMASGQPFQCGQTASRPELQALAVDGVHGLYMIGVVNETELRAGMVLLRYEPSQGWNDPENRLLEGAAQILGALLLRLEHTRQLEAAYEGALRAIGLALEARDRETAGHTDRVAALAEQLGRALGMSETELRDLRWGAYLHDVGKLTIPDAILLKPGKLTPEEFSTMKTHAPLGDDLVRNLPFVPPAARQIVRHHHERWDGRGYPDGLAAENIPLSARIFAICDVFDALCSERPYKAAMPPEMAAQELWRSVHGGHLDRRLVEVFLRTQGLEEAMRVSQAAD